MAISVDWGTKVISVPRADLTLVQAVPTEVRELELNWFRLQLKDLEDNTDGICFPDTHRHNTTVTIGSLVLARVIEIINGYTLTFEDGNYCVSIVGGNSNLMDVLNLNQVAVRGQNSAGMTVAPATTAEIFGRMIDGLSFENIQKLAAAAAAGLVSGATDGQADEWIEVRNVNLGNKVRIRSLDDQFGNRKQIILDLTD